MAESLVGTGLTVLIEKPLAPTGDEGRRFLEICKADTKGTYMVGHHRRHNCYVRAIKDVLDKKELGRIVAVNGGKTICSECVAKSSIPDVWLKSGHSASQSNTLASHGTSKLELVEWYGPCPTAKIVLMLTDHTAFNKRDP